MKRKKSQKPQRSRSKATSAGSTPAKSQKMSRRDMLAWAKFGAIGAGVVGLGGWYFVSEVRASIHEQDLTRIGNGIPTVVQIHDPGCSSCQALQRQARKAIDEMPEGSVQFLVANITQPDGRQFANSHNVGHVTLILFDGRGRRRDVLVGNRTAPLLRTEFERLLPRPTSGS